MFVKLIKGKKETVYDCKRVSFNPDDELIIMDVGEQDERSVNFALEKGNVMFLMNNDGKTIDKKVG